MVTATNLPTSVTAGQAGHIGHTNTLHTAVNDLTAASALYPIESYGAVAPGADVKAAITAAILAAEADGGGTVVIPAGTFLLSGQISGRSNVNLVGAGRDHTILQLQTGTLASYFLYRAADRDHITLQGITFDGTTGHPDATALIGVAFDSCTDVQVLDCGFIRCRRALYGSNNGATRNERIHIARNLFDATTEDYAIDFSNVVGANSSKAVFIVDNIVKGVVKKSPTTVPSPTGIYVRAENVLIKGNTVEASADTAVMTASASAKNVTITGNNLKATQVCVYMGQSATVGTISGNILRSERDFGIHLDTGDAAGQELSMRVNVVGNVILDTGKSGICVEGGNDLVVASNQIKNPGALRPGTGTPFEGDYSGLAILPAPIGGGGENVMVEGNSFVDDRATPLMGNGIHISASAAYVGLGNNLIRGARTAGVFNNGRIYSPNSDTRGIVTGESTIPRLDATDGTISLTSGSMRLTYFTATKSETCNTVRVFTGGTAAGATPTLVRVGVYSVASDGSLTLVASTASSTSLFASAATVYARTLTASFDKIAGQRYALGILVVTAAAAPTTYGAAPLIGSEMAITPRLAAVVSGLTDIPSTVATGGVTDSNRVFYAVVLP